MIIILKTAWHVQLLKQDRPNFTHGFCLNQARKMWPLIFLCHFNKPILSSKKYQARVYGRPKMLELCSIHPSAILHICSNNHGVILYSLRQAAATPTGGQRSLGGNSAQVDFISSSLQMKIYKLLEEKCNGLYVQHLSKVFETKYKIKAPENLTEMVKSFDFVNYEE